MTAPTIGSLCSGYGGLDLAVERFFGAETVWFSEFEAAPSKVLEAHWPGVPNHGDMTKVDWASVEPVDIICGGTPCQDLSAAGARKGMTEGTRSNLWVQMREAIAIIRPRIVIWENVRGALSAYATSEMESEPGLLGESYGPDRPALRAIGRVYGDLSELGYRAAGVLVRASDAGAPHARARVFIIAVAADADGIGRREGRPEPAGRLGGSAAVVGGAHAADTDREGLSCLGRIVTVECDADRRSGESGARCGTEPEASADAASFAGCIGDGDDVRARRGTVGYEQAAGRGAAEDADIAARCERRVAASGEAEGGRSRTDTGGRGGAPATHPDDAADDGERACPEPREGGGAATDAERIGHERRRVGRAVGIPARTSEGDRGERQRDGYATDDRSAEVEWGPYEPAIRRWESVLGRVAPAPTNPDGKGGAHRLAPEFVEWMMGLPTGWVTDPDIGISRNEQLKALGNGVVPQQAELALSIAWDRLADVREAVAA